MNKLVLLLIMLLFGLGIVVAQTELILSDYTTGQYVNLQILADTLADGSQAHDIYKVEADKIYAFDGTLYVDFNLIVEGPDDTWIYDQAGPPLFLQMPAATVRDMFNIRSGGSITLKNAVYGGLLGDDNNISSFVNTVAGDNIIADNCVFSDHIDHAFRITGQAQKISLTNCIFINGVRRRFNPFGGMPIRIDAEADSILLENNTSVNSGRLLGNGIDGFHSIFHELHNTYLNMQVNAHELHWFEGLEANNIFYNWSWRGRDANTIGYEAYLPPWDRYAQVETMLDSISLYHGRNLFFIESAILDYFENEMADAGIMPCLLWSADVDTTIEEDDNFIIGKVYWQFDPMFTTPPGNTDAMLEWIMGVWVTNPAEAPDWRITPVVDYGTGVPVLNWPPAFDLSYTNDTLLTAGTDGLPLGDLNWFPDAKTTYLADRDAYIAALRDSVENATSVYTPGDSASALITSKDFIDALEDFINGPSEFSLSHNYPNPFNPTTSIAFKLDKTGDISMKIYDITGQLVKTVIDNKNYTVGAHIVTINMANYSSGVYFTVLESGSKKLVRKMMLIK